MLADFAVVPMGVTVGLRRAEGRGENAVKMVGMVLKMREMNSRPSGS